MSIRDPKTLSKEELVEIVYNMIEDSCQILGAFKIIQIRNKNGANDAVIDRLCQKFINEYDND